MAQINILDKPQRHNKPTEGLDWSKPLVTIRCTAYKQEKYIRDALEGFVMQETTFPFEAIVHDDASPDGTADIIREYAEKFPHIIKPIYQTENQYSKGMNSRMGSDINAMTSPHSKYIALCEGDDYWTDPLKLQKQVEFLETHPDYSMCFTGANVITHDGKPSSLYQSLETRDYNGDEIIREWLVPTASVLYHKEIQKMVPKSRRFIYGDNVLFLTCAQYGKVHCIAEKMATYRAGVGVLSKMGKNRAIHLLKHLKHTKELLRCFPIFKQGIEPCLYSSLDTLLLEKSISKDKKKKVYKYMLLNHTKITLKITVHKIINKLKTKI